MLTCEKCGVSFEQPDQLQEVTSLRVLCPACTAARAAAKAQKAAGSSEARNAAPVPAKKLQARDAVRPAPESRPAQPDARPAQPEVRTARVDAGPREPRPAPAQRDAAPAQPRPRPAQAHPANATKVAASAVRPSASSARPAQAAAAKNAAKPPAKPAPKKKPTIDLDTLESRNLQKRSSREIWMAFAGAIIVFGIAGGVLWKVLGKHKAEAAAEHAYEERVANFRQTFAGFDVATEQGARDAIKYGEDNREIWQDLDELGAEVQSRTAKANTFLEALEERTELTGRLTSLEETLGRAAELAPTELAELRRRLDELLPKAAFVSAEFEVRLAKDRADAERVHLERLMAIAETTGTAETLDRAALSTLAQVEDDVFRMLDATAKASDKKKDDAELAAKKEELTAKYRRVMELNDQAVERFFTPEVIEAMPWRDLLSNPKDWKMTESKGFEHTIDGGVLHLVTAPDEKEQPTISIGDKEIWRDFIIEMDITILRGGVEFFFRLPPQWQKNVESLGLTTNTDEAGYLEQGRNYTYSFSIVASTIVYEQMGEDSPGATREGVNWTQIRKGAFGIAVPKDTEIKITKLRAKVLR